MSTVKDKYMYLITDGCDEAGEATHTLRVDARQLQVLLDKDLIYEDTVSDYVQDSHRRHYHPMHENISFGALADIVTYWPGYGGISRAIEVYRAAGDITINVASNKHL